MEPKEFIYRDDKRGTVTYVGPTSDDEDHTFDPNYVNELKASRQYEKALEYIDNYSYSSPTYYNRVQLVKDEITRNIRIRDHKSKYVTDEDDVKMKFLQQYESGDFDLTNEYSRDYLRAINDMFGDGDQIRINFDKEKKRLLWIDALAKDNTENNINSYKKRLAQSLGFEDGVVSNSYLAEQGVEIGYPDDSGKGYLIVKKNSPIRNKVLEAVTLDSYQPTITQYDKKGLEARTSISFSKDNSLIGIGRGNFMTDFTRLTRLIDEAKNSQKMVSERSEITTESTILPFVFQTTEDYDRRINNGGEDGSAASKMSKEYERRLIAAARNQYPGKNKMSIIYGKGYDNLDENGLEVIGASTEQQAKVLDLFSSASDNDISAGLYMRTDGKIGIAFTINYKDATGKTPERPKVQFVLYDWNTDLVQEGMMQMPQYRATRELNEISSFGATYTALDGQSYKHIGGYGVNARFEDEYGDEIKFNDLHKIVQRDLMCKDQRSDWLSRYFNSNGTVLNEDMLNIEVSAAAMKIYYGVEKQTPYRTGGAEMPINDIYSILNSNLKSFVNFGYGIPEPSQRMLAEIASYKAILENQLHHYRIYNTKQNKENEQK